MWCYKTVTRVSTRWRSSDLINRSLKGVKAARARLSNVVCKYFTVRTYL